MQMTRTFQAWGTCGNEHIWTIDEGKDYPRLAWENQPGEDISSPPLTYFLMGTGTESDPFLIYTPEGLNMVGLFPCEFDKHFKLMADVDMSGFDGTDGRPAFNIIGGDCSESSNWQVKDGTSGLLLVGTPFAGVFDGNGHTISNLTVVGNSHLGVFGALGLPAEVKNLGTVDAKIRGLGNYVGALAGYNGGNVIGCYSNSLVNGTGGVGGLVGENWGSISSSYSSGSVIGGSAVGGFVGGNSYGSISLSYSSGPVIGKDRVGGLVGGNWGSIATSYSSGAVDGTSDIGGLVGSNTVSWGNKGIVSDSLWDTQTSGQATSDGGTGKTTAEMQTASTFLDTGWDFVDETANGAEDIWWIFEGQDYPRLWWEDK